MEGSPFCGEATVIKLQPPDLLLLEDEGANRGGEIAGLDGVVMWGESEKKESAECRVDVVFLEEVGKLSEEGVVKVSLFVGVTEEKVLHGFIVVSALGACGGMCASCLMKFMGSR